jgi:NAD(P)-dependent dehydrogenase (short-subunit alcohol dehydrogenase family)
MAIILITGANRGIGFGFAHEYLKRGDRVFAACRTPARAVRLQELKKGHDERLTLLPLDVTNPESIEAAAQQMQRGAAAIDVLINNAGVFFPSAGLKDLEPETLAQSFAVNSIAPLMIIRRFLPLLEAGFAPKIVNITQPTRPIHQLQRTENHAYLASRYALNALTKMAALELKAQGVIVAAVWPGYIKTDMNNMAEDAAAPEDALPQVVRLIGSLTMEQTGCCLLPDGKVFEW